MIGENERDELRTVVLHRLVSELGDAGKTKLQKLAYFLQEAFKVPLGFQFRMHHYGPYSYDLDDKLSEMKLLGYINIAPDPNGYGYHVTPADMNPPEAVPVSNRYGREITQVSEHFKHMDAADLELRATIHFVRAILGNQKKDAIVSAVLLQKPKFSRETIDHAYDELKKLT